MHLFYCNNIQSGAAILSAEESGHCIRVLRLAKGDIVKIIDGTGTSYDAEISIPDSKKCELKIIQSFTDPAPRNYKIHIAIAPTKNMDRFEWFVEKAVEIGIDIITPLLCMRSERKVLKTDRLQKLIISTMKQAKISRLPVINELTSYNAFLKQFKEIKENRFIAHCDQGHKMALKSVCQKNKDTLIMIGPEGDFSDEEITSALSKQFIPVTLGPNRLRTETAGVVACHSVVFINEDNNL